jgi:hypothetical protein
LGEDGDLLWPQPLQGVKRVLPCRLCNYRSHPGFFAFRAFGITDPSVLREPLVDGLAELAVRLAEKYWPGAKGRRLNMPTSRECLSRVGTPDHKQTQGRTPSGHAAHLRILSVRKKHKKGMTIRRLYEAWKLDGGRAVPTTAVTREDFYEDFLENPWPLAAQPVKLARPVLQGSVTRRRHDLFATAGCGTNFTAVSGAATLPGPSR